MSDSPTAPFSPYQPLRSLPATRRVSPHTGGEKWCQRWMYLICLSTAKHVILGTGDGMFLLLYFVFPTPSVSQRCGHGQCALP
ncbi:hypothetical protein HDV62DRAFT_377539 [Trichoderma sp. SZMC 28011]